MADAPVIHSRSVLRQMDHFIMALKTDAAQDRPSFFLSLYWIEYAADAEPGHVAYLWTTGIDGVAPIEAVITDNLAIPDAIGHRLRPGQWPLVGSDPTGPTRPLPAHHVARLGDLVPHRGRGPGRRRALGDAVSPPVYATGPTSSRDALITTMLTEAHLPSRDGERHPPAGRPVPQPDLAAVVRQRAGLVHHRSGRDHLRDPRRPTRDDVTVHGAAALHVRRDTPPDGRGLAVAARRRIVRLPARATPRSSSTAPRGR